MSKSTVEEIRTRFDHDVERFSNLETGQSATIDAPLVLELITQTAARCTPHATDLIDVGCGAGNYSLKMLSQLPNLNVRLIDLSKPMLTRAAERVSAATSGTVKPIQGDVRELDLGENSCDLILAAAVLHHLRTPDEWHEVFAKFYRALRPGGSLWISDLITQSIPAVQNVMWRRYGEYLSDFRDDAYRDQVFAYIEKEDSPAPIMFQIDTLRAAGFTQVDFLHKNGPFAAFGAVK